MDDFCFQRFNFGSQDSGRCTQSSMLDGSQPGFPTDPRRSVSSQPIRGRFGLPRTNSSLSAGLHNILLEIRSEVDGIPRTVHSAVEAGTNFVYSGVEETKETLKALFVKVEALEKQISQIQDAENIKNIAKTQEEIKEAILNLSKALEEQKYEINKINGQIEKRLSPRVQSQLSAKSSPSLLQSNCYPLFSRRGLNHKIRKVRSFMDS